MQQFDFEAFSRNTIRWVSSVVVLCVANVPVSHLRRSNLFLSRFYNDAAPTALGMAIKQWLRTGD
jgi:hypothetical protein